jgi:uncharacterized membrane protein
MSENEKPAEEQQDDVVAAAAVEADPHGATVVGAVGTEEGVAAVGAIETDYANTVMVAAFAHPEAANAAYLSLLDASIKGVLRIDGALTFHTDAEGKVHVDKLTEHSTKSGFKWGAVAGFVLGAIFPPTLLASTVAGSVVGSFVGKGKNLAVRHVVGEKLQGSLGPNQSCILALVHAGDVEHIKAQMPEATQVTTEEVSEEDAKSIAEAAKEADKEG